LPGLCRAGRAFDRPDVFLLFLLGWWKNRPHISVMKTISHMKTKALRQTVRSTALCGRRIILTGSIADRRDNHAPSPNNLKKADLLADVCYGGPQVIKEREHATRI
jgi:hypothetical protein